MSRVSLNELHEEILHNLTKKDFIKKISLSEEKIQSLVLNKAFTTKLSVIIAKTRISCDDVRELSIEILNSLSENLPKDWLKYVYEYTLYKSFPDSVSIKLNPKYEDAVVVYLEILKTVFYSVEKHQETESFSFNSFISNNNTDFERNEDFQKFKKVYIDNYIYELILLEHELTNSKLYYRIRAVWSLSMQIAQSLKMSGVNLKPWLVSCLTIGHFIGNYAVKHENNSIAFYTRQWFEKFDLSNIIGVEIYNDILSICFGHLPIESLILMYSDLRVDIKNNTKTYLNSLEQIEKAISEEFDISKDQSRLIVDKIKDFESYLSSNNVDIKFSSEIIRNSSNTVATVLLEENEIIDYYKNISVESNIKVMNLLSDEINFNYMLEKAKAAKSWKDIMIYLNIFDEYTLYLSKNKKMKILDFLYSLLNSSDQEIRKLAAKLLGKTIALFDSNEIENLIDSGLSSLKLWEKYLGLFILSENLNDKENAVFYLHDFIDSFIKSISNDTIEIYIEVLLKHFEKISSDEDTVILLLTSLNSIKIEFFNNEQIDIVFNNIIKYLNSGNEDVKFVSLNYIYTIIQSESLGESLISKILEHVQNINTDDKVGINFLKYKILLNINKTDRIITEYNEFMRIKSKRISEIFLINLKSATNWMEKIVNIDFILDIVRNSNDVVLLHTATHLCNLVKVSAKEVVRNKAGKALLSISSFLTIDQRNEISIELIKGLEIGEFEISKYIPNHLGKFILLLDTKELDEIIFEILRLYNDSNSHVSSLALKVFSVMIENYSEYKEIFEQIIDKYSNRFIKILSIIISGLANNDEQIRMDTLFFIGNQIFNSKILGDNDKYKIFKCIAKKLISLTDEKNTDYLNFLNTANSFNYIYKFLSGYNNVLNDKYDVTVNNKIAYFCNSFDPFTLEHKKIIKEIKSLGYDVFLEIDESSWWKNTQPYKIRRKIIDISIADELDTYLLSESLKINFANPDDIVKLKSMFADKEIYIIARKEMLLNQAVYKQKLSKNSIYAFNHLILDSDNIYDSDESDKINEVRKKIKGEIIDLSISPINETKNLAIDSQALKYIYNTGIYLRESQDKTLADKSSLKIEIINDLSENVADEIGRYIFMYTNLYENIGEELANKNISLLVIRENSQENRLLGFSAFHHIGTAQMYREFGNIEIANYVRENTSGKIIIIDGIYTNPSEKIPELEQTLLTETLLHGLKNDFTYALYCNTLLNYDSDETSELLELHGFKKLDAADLKNHIYAVDMKFPICLTLDMQNYIKEPLISSQRLKELVSDTRKRLKLVLAKLYPNSLVLSFDVQMLQQALVEKISEISLSDSDYLCVPFGNVFSGKIVANVATKSLHIEKCFNYDTGDFEITQYPFYSSISKQIDVIKSFNKPVILVDDVMHNCHEIIGIDKVLRAKGVDVKRIIAGILSSNGKDIMEIRERSVDSAYFIPNLRLWLRESMLYPFFGGNTVLSENELKLNLIPSINQILPYASPIFMKDAAKDVIYDLSMLCLENARDISKALEQEYKSIFDKNLVLKNLCEVLSTPRYPAKGKNLCYDLDQKISDYIENDIKNLIRIRSIMKI